MIFPKLIVEEILQVEDKTRLDATASFTSIDEADVTLVEIEPEAGSGFIDVTNGVDAEKWYLDWAYATDGDKVVSIRITTDAAPTTKTSTISVLTAAEDSLFSNDSDLKCHENDILEYIPKGRCSWIDKHRCSQELILDYLNDQGVFKPSTNGGLDYDRLTKIDIYKVEEVNKWSKYWTLELIFESLIVSPDDIFHDKMQNYRGLRIQAQNAGRIRLDIDQDGNPDSVNNRRTFRVVKR